MQKIPGVATYLGNKEAYNGNVWHEKFENFEQVEKYVSQNYQKIDYFYYMSPEAT